MQAKETVQSLLERLPDDCSLDDVLYHLYVIQMVERGIADADAGRLIPHETVAEEMRLKWQVGRAYIGSPHLVHPDQAREFQKEVLPE